ncbi:unnamed protein product [Rotaria sordida]|uniref:Hint domain-containing protein n=2 Tax=Rotaria sordida TaxID=392033 RepID=A0A814KGA3_9BILA|nr:unnamed protein product [Rotaria sordida]
MVENQSIRHCNTNIIQKINGRSISDVSSKSSSSSSASSSASGCFASDTLITLSNKKQIPIEQLQSNDKLLTTDGSIIFSTQFMLMLDKNRFSKAMFHTITTASGHNVSLTGLHLIPIIENNNTINYIPAKQIKINDNVYVMSNDQLISSAVTSVTIETKTGYYAPMTTSGTLFAGGIMTSSYANVQNHEAAHFSMGLLRFYYWLAQLLFINEPFGHQNIEGIHIVPKAMYELVQFLYPSAIRFS